MRGFELAMCDVAIVIGWVGIVVGFLGWVFAETRVPRRSQRGTAEGWALVVAAAVVLTLILCLCVVFGARPGGVR
jgi:hypothetical protein